MKDHSHNQILYEMLKSQPFIFIKDIRGWCNYRSRLSNLRPRAAAEGYAIVAYLQDNQHAYKLEPLKKEEPQVIKTQAQLEFAI